MNRVYLCGPITGTTYEECTNWREKAAKVFIGSGLEPLSPMRGKEFMKGEANFQDSYDEMAEVNKHTIFNRDKFDCMHSEILLMNLMGATEVSIGSVMELAWAHANGNFCVLVMEGKGNPHEHAFIKEALSVRFNDLNDALEYISRTFGK